jgi:ABC-type branched-subunit amino acid transport system permease subunit
MVVLGGMGSITGCAVTAALLKILENVLRSLTGTAVVFYVFILIGAALSYHRYRERRVRFGLQVLAGIVALTLLLIFARGWLTDNIAFLRGVFYALLLILLMLTRPQGLLGKAELSAATLRRLTKMVNG